MRGRRHLGVVSLVVGVAALVLGLTVSPAQAAPPEKVGWWFQPLAGPLALPVPVPVVPDGGLFVQQGATTEPLAFGALRYAVPEGSSNSLTLTAAAGSVALAASMQACKTTTTWEATSGGPGSWDKRPSFRTPCAPGVVSSDGAAVAFNLNSSFLSGGALDIAIVPLSAATPFAVAFDPPADDALQSATGKPSTSPTLPPPPTVAGSPGASGSSGASTPAKGVGAASPATAAAAPVAPDASTRSPAADSVLNVVGLGDPDRGARAASLGGASLIVVGWWLLSTQSVRLPRLLGGVGTGAAAAAAELPDDKDIRVGGVGRFAKTRATDATKLR